MPTTSLDLAKHYWVDDVASAATAGTRLNNILESLAKGRPLTDASKHLLTERGLFTLIGFANGEIVEEQFNELARAEREARISAAQIQELAMELQRQADLAAMEVQRQADLAADEAREAAMWARLEAERIKRESDPRFKDRELRRKYGVEGFMEEHHFKRVMAILRKLDSGVRLAEDAAVWLSSEGREYATREILHAHNRLEATFCIAEYKRTGDVWMAVSASGHLRKCDASNEALGLLAGIPDSRLKQAKLKSAVRTTHGGAMRDLGRHIEAMKFGEEAHALLPENFRPCTLLGAINIELGHVEVGHAWYRKAEERGAETDSIVSDLRSVLARMSASKREETIGQLLMIDPVRYGRLRRTATGTGHLPA